MNTKSNWYDSMENLANLARYIIEKDGEIDTVYFLEKPYKWENEWLEYQASLNGRDE